MFKFQRLFILFFSVTLLFSCKSDVEPQYPVPHSIADKTIFVYMPWSASRTSASGSLYSAFMKNIDDMKTAIKNDAGLGGNRLLIFISTSATKAVLMEVVYENGTCRQDTLETYDNTNMPAFTTSNGIADILNKVKAVAPAKKYAMIIGCHGTGWLFANAGSRVQTRYFGGSEAYFQTDIPVLAQGIGKADIKMQFVMFDDCYMANVEVAYELRKVTEHLIGCASEILAYGMPYHKIWRYLAQDKPDYQKVVDEFHDFYSTYSTPCGNIGVADCSIAEEMASVMHDINTVHTFNLTDTLNVQKLDGYRNTIFYDMDAYVQQLCATDAGRYANFRATLSRFVPYKATTASIYTNLGELTSRYITVNNFGGITISDPTVSTFERAVNNKTRTSWWIATHN